MPTSISASQGCTSANAEHCPLQMVSGKGVPTSLLMVESLWMSLWTWLSMLLPDENLASVAECDSFSRCFTMTSQAFHSAITFWYLRAMSASTCRQRHILGHCPPCQKALTLGGNRRERSKAGAGSETERPKDAEALLLQQQHLPLTGEE